MMATITKRSWQTTSGEARSAWVLAWTDKDGARHKEQHARKRDAEARHADIQIQMRGGTYRAAADKKTVGDALDAYIDHLQTRNAKGQRAATGYFRNSKAQLDRLVRPILGDTKLADLTTGAVVRLRENLLAAETGVVSVRRTLGTLSRALKLASEHDWIASNPARGVTVLSNASTDRKKVTPPSKKTLAAILKAADPETAIRIRFASATGLRASEMWGLQWRDVDLAKRHVEVRRTVDIFGAVNEQTKSAAGRRRVPLGAVLAEQLAGRRGVEGEKTHRPDNAFVFPDAVGGFTRHSNHLRRVWNPLLEKAGAEGTGWHALRHFAISTWVLSGMHMKAVQTLAGHASFQMTADRYSHLLPEDVPTDIFDKLAADIAA